MSPAAAPTRATARPSTTTLRSSKHASSCTGSRVTLPSNSCNRHDTAGLQASVKPETCMRYTIVTETYPPEVNGVALTVQELERGLRARGHDVELVRPRRHRRERGGEGEMLAAGVRLPFYAGLRFGLPSAAMLKRRWRRHRPGAIYIATEGPLGWSAMRAAAALGIPVASGFHTRFDHYMRD